MYFSNIYHKFVEKLIGYARSGLVHIILYIRHPTTFEYDTHKSSICFIFRTSIDKNFEILSQWSTYRFAFGHSKSIQYAFKVLLVMNEELPIHYIPLNLNPKDLVSLAHFLNVKLLTKFRLQEIQI